MSVNSGEGNSNWCCARLLVCSRSVAAVLGSSSLPSSTALVPFMSVFSPISPSKDYFAPQSLCDFASQSQAPPATQHGCHEQVQQRRRHPHLSRGMISAVSSGGQFEQRFERCVSSSRRHALRGWMAPPATTEGAGSRTPGIGSVPDRI